MIKFTSTLLDDQSQILRWALHDPYHCSGIDSTGPGWWLTGSDSLVAGCIEDERGPVMYYRFDLEKNDLVRMHTQFAPPDEVSPLRVIRSIRQAMQVFIIDGKQKGAKGFIFQSTSPTLIRFMATLGFEPFENDDYLLLFERT